VLFRFRIKRVDVVMAKVDKAIVLIRQGFTRKTGEDMLTHLFTSMPPYPPELPNQVYVRTHQLYKALRSERGEHRMSLSEVRAIGGEQVVILGLRGGTEKLYGTQVVGFPHQQRPIHQGRWFTLISHVGKQMAKLVDIVEKGTGDLLRKAGFR